MRCPCCGMRVHEEKYPREGDPWTRFEKDLLSESVDRQVHDLSGKFGRSPNALWWAIWRYVREKKR